jgi:hypothetical protein
MRFLNRFEHEFRGSEKWIRVGMSKYPRTYLIKSSPHLFRHHGCFSGSTRHCIFANMTADA